ncbi:MAG: Type 1 glutamine amidotransferase-like domain-containing protein [Candidatus Limnocylindrales bacterium]
MDGLLVLVGSEGFTPAMEAVDREALAATGRQRPRVAILPTAAAPDGEPACMRLAEMGRQHFGALGAEVETVRVYGRAEADDEIAAQAVGEADLVYLCGGHPMHLYEALAGTAVGRALRAGHRRGTVIIASGAAAMVLADRQPHVMRGRPVPRGWTPALGLLPRIALIPAYDALPEALMMTVVLMPPRSGVVLGLDRQTALVGRDGTWQVEGAGRLTIWQGRHRTRYRDGEVVRL